jgi:aminoglycoside phosphotransferase (APT) family kinase protein
MERVVPDEAQLHAIVSRHYPSDVRVAQVVHHHCNTHAYLTMEDDTRVVVRICDGPYWTERAHRIEKFKREKCAWEYLKRVDGIVTPEVIAIETDESILPCPFVIMTHVPGTPMNEVIWALSPDEQIRLIEELGALAHSIHALEISIASLPSEMMQWGGHREDLGLQLQDLTTRGLITAPARAKVERLIDRYSSQLAAMDDDIVFLHGDLHFGNVLLQREDEQWHVSGLVDAELAGAGPRGRELCAPEQFSFKGLGTHWMREAFLRGYGDGYGRDEYKLAYLTCALDPDFPNRELLEVIESSDHFDGLNWIDIFSE